MPRTVIHLFTCIVLALLLQGAVGCGPSPKRAVLNYESVAERVHRDTQAAKAKNTRAAQLVEAGELGEAEKLLKEALSADVMFGPAHNNLGKVYYHQKEMYLAAWEFQYAARLMPDHPEPRNNLGLVLEAAGKLDEAAAAYDEALKLEPANADVMGNLARVKLKRGDRDESVRSLLSDLIVRDRRPAWIDWAREQLVTMEGDRP